MMNRSGHSGLNHSYMCTSENDNDLTSSVRRHMPSSLEQYHEEHGAQRSALRRSISKQNEYGLRRPEWPVVSAAAAFVSGALVLLGAGSNTNTLYIELRMLRGTFLLLLMLFLIIGNMYVWRKTRIDYARILSLDQVPSVCCTSQPAESVADRDDEEPDESATTSFSKLACVFSSLWIISVLIVVYVWELRGPVSVSRHAPFSLWLVIVLCLVLPAPVLYHQSRRWMCYRLWCMIAAPLYPVRFVDTWIADQLTSLPLVLLDFEYTTCVIVKVQWLGSYLDNHGICMSPTIGIRQALNILPSWFRFAQCCRVYYDTRNVSNLINAGKYFSILPMVVAASFVAEKQELQKNYYSTTVFYVWLCFALIHAIYVFSWDVIMDWGLFRHQNTNPGLRSCLLYRRRWLYYTAIALDAVLRFAWTLKMSLSVSIWFGSDRLLLLLAVGEVLRRFMWNFFRVEHEQVRHYEDLSSSYENYETVAGVNCPEHESIYKSDESGGDSTEGAFS
ncbi:solute carrier family 53 member 1-like [Sycon ciliatum]|uniref:solute carrier family 53 member 1-like n=1 Tax=Sycon ciliatum TaxID=27933 RepID=UPI0020A893BE|eukprot:scpid43164/ scgid23519/ Xenotropic and polytropic retrovirus receptor 1; Protein SYG1 homolog; Xenotropic and polytropic murine leukemia virus receptor X3